MPIAMPINAIARFGFFQTIHSEATRINNVLTNPRAAAGSRVVDIRANAMSVSNTADKAILNAIHSTRLDQPICGTSYAGGIRDNVRPGSFIEGR